MPRDKSSPAAPSPEHTLPATWPQFTNPEYYSWMMARMPADAIVADWSKHQPHNSYSPLFWYVDKELQCAACSREFVFSKEEQRHWYEDLKFAIFVRAKHCPECRARVREQKQSARIAQQKHMAEVAARKPHPNEAFFKKRT